MSIVYRAVDWNRQKRICDLTLIGLLVLGLGVFGGVSLWVSPRTTVETLIIRGFAVAALLLLHVILAIGPMARLDHRFLPLLYNRRHLGVILFVLALVHAAFSMIQFHALGDENPLVSVFTAYRRDYRVLVHGDVNLAHFPFEPFGACALAILFLMAATSHDFWLRQLGSSLWKSLHLGVYVAYGSLILHVSFGVLQTERSLVYPILILLGFGLLAGLHLAAARKEARLERAAPAESKPEGFEAVCLAADLIEGHGKVVRVGGHRVALFRHLGKVHALSNVCRHQGGPIGEGRILDGCITCPWHGWTYQPEDGRSPPPFHEKLDTYGVQIIDGRVWVRSKPCGPTPTTTIQC